MRKTLLTLSVLSLLGCSSDPSSAGPHVPETTMSAPTAVVPPPEEKKEEKPAIAPLALDVDPVAVGLTAPGITRLCDGSIAKAQALLDQVRALKGAGPEALTWAATLGRLDEATLALRNAGDFPQLMAVAHPDEEVRKAAKSCEPKVEKFTTALYLDADLAAIFRRYAERKELLSGPRARLLEHTLRDYRRNGLELDPAKQAKVRALNEKISKISQDFESNIAASTLFIEVTKDQLKGLPESYVESHKADEKGKIQIKTDYPDYFPFLQYAADRQAAFELYKKFDNRAADKNVALLGDLLGLREEKAKLLGYTTWADYILEPRMARDAKTVASFLEGLRQHVAKKGTEELRDFVAMNKKLGGKTDEILISDRTYLEDQVRKAKFGLDSKEVSQYFEIGRVKQGLLDITGRMFGLTYHSLKAATGLAEAPAIWHPDVEPYEVLDSKGTVLGRFYFDLYPRADKYKHAAVFSIRETKTMEGGGRLMPIAAIVCNFPKAGGASPALMSHGDVTTFFHEFGHVLHHLLSESELASFSGTSVARDFVESPSQMLEEWAWNRETLDLFARHHETGKQIPDKLYKAMIKARSFGRAISTQRQLFLAALDQNYHTRPAGFDTTKVLEETQNAYLPFKYVPDTHFQATFGHLIGYDAGYYGYQWALSISRDLFSRFQVEGLLNLQTAADYRAAILAPGGSQDESKLIEHFLGRPPSDESYRRFLNGDERPAKGGHKGGSKGEKGEKQGHKGDRKK